jgi:hypothetical protein
VPVRKPREQLRRCRVATPGDLIVTRADGLEPCPAVRVALTVRSLARVLMDSVGFWLGCPSRSRSRYVTACVRGLGCGDRLRVGTCIDGDTASACLTPKRCPLSCIGSDTSTGAPRRCRLDAVTRQPYRRRYGWRAAILRAPHRPPRRPGRRRPRPGVDWPGDPAAAPRLLASATPDTGPPSPRAATDARAQGCSWAEIGDLLGTASAAAWNRHGRQAGQGSPDGSAG